MNLDLPLSDLVASAKKNNRKTQAPKVQHPSSRPHPVQQIRQPAPQSSNAQPIGDKIIISNLPTDVSQSQISTLFTDTVGKLKSIVLAYNAKGESTGVCTVVFSHVEDAAKAFKQYNGRLIDGKKAMKVEIVVDPSRAISRPLGSRISGAPSEPRVSKAVPIPANNGPRPARGAAGPKRGGGRGGGRGGKGKREERPKATLESLDAEMADYAASSAAPAV